MEWLQYILFKAVFAVLSLPPLGMLFRLGQVLGWLAWRLAWPYRVLALENIYIAFGDEKTSAERKQIGRAHFLQLGGNLLCSAKLGTLTRDQLLKRVEVENVGTARTLLEGGRGVIGVLCHLGNWELFTRIPDLVPGFSFATIYQPLENARIDRDLQAVRTRFGVTTFDRKEGFSAPMKFLREGGGLAVLADQHAGDAGVWAPLFGRLASTSPLPATLALRTGAALVPVAVYTIGVARWKMVFSDALPQETGEPEAVTAKINQEIERQIRVQPADWFWVHNRWKTPKPKFLLASYKRGVAWPAGFDRTALKPFRILIRSTNWLGDAVMSVPAVRAIKRGRPDAQVTILTSARLADFWKHVPEIDEVITFEKGEGPWRVSRKLKAHYDAAILFPSSLRSALEVALAGIPRRVGFAGHCRSWLLNQIPSRERPIGPPRHQMHDFLDLAHAVGAAREDMWQTVKTPVLRPARERWRLGLCPGAEYGPAKRWPATSFAEAARLVSAQTPSEWLLFGIESDVAFGVEIKKVLGGGQCTNLIGRTTLAELIERLRECDLLLTNDTGTMHLAAFLGVPMVAVFGSTEPALTGPVGSQARIVRHHVECSPCFLRECPIDFRCMREISPEQVAQVVMEELRGPKMQH